MNPSLLSLMLMIMIHATSAQTSLINSTCATVARSDPNVDYGFCQSSLQAAHGSGGATLRGLGLVSLTLLRSNVSDTRSRVRRLLKSREWDHYTKLCLGDCFQLFSDALPSAKQAIRYYAMKMFDDANVQISSVMDAATTCEDGFTEASPLTKPNDDVFRLAAVALSVMRMVQDN